jgi:hypothetical protein
MSILSVTQEWRGYSGGDDVESTEHNASFIVTFDDADPPAQRPLLALTGQADPAGKRVPMGFERHPYNPYLYIIRRHITPGTDTGKGPMIFTVDVTYSNRPIYCNGDSAAAALADPLSMPPDIEWTGQDVEQMVDTAYDGNNELNIPIENTVGDQPDPRLTEIETYPMCRITRAESNFAWANVYTYRNTVNSDTFGGCQPGCVLLRRFDARRRMFADIFYWEVTYELVFNWRGWTRRVLNAGFRHKKEGTQKIVAATVDGGDPGPDHPRVSEPVKLTIAGERCEKFNSDGIIIGWSAPYWLSFNTKRTSNLNNLNL